MFRSAIYSFKYFLRICDCLPTYRWQMVNFRGYRYPFFATYWWNNVSQETFNQEILPYFDALENFRPAVILDAGAATGHFSIIAAKIFQECVVYAFEPSQRQRILLLRNVRLNGVTILEIEPLGVWNTSNVLPFRTIEAESSFAPVGRYQGMLEFPETVRVVALDEWAAQKRVEQIDLIKIDAEDAELEILEEHKQPSRDFTRVFWCRHIIYGKVNAHLSRVPRCFKSLVTTFGSIRLNPDF